MSAQPAVRGMTRATGEMLFNVVWVIGLVVVVALALFPLLNP